MSDIWFTADTHFGHSGMIKFGHRPFATVEIMDCTLTDLWRACIKPKDTVYHLGDFCLHKDPLRYLKWLTGKIHLVLGNHDDETKLRKTNAFVSIQDVLYLRHGGERFFLSHYAHRVWRNSHHGSYHLFGHSHGDLPNAGRSMDVGADANGFIPVHIDEVLKKLKPEFVTYHHGGYAQQADGVPR